MFGSDWPVCRLAAGYADVLSTSRELIGRLGDDEQRSVLAGTARRVYRLSEPGP
jgi:L-fuconolactonase